MITWDSVGHFFATGWHDISVAARAIADHQSQVQVVVSKVEEVTAGAAVFFPPALEALEIERVSMFAFGIVCQLILVAGGPDAASKAHPGVHPGLFQQASQLMGQYPSLVNQAKAMLK